MRYRALHLMFLPLNESASLLFVALRTGCPKFYRIMRRVKFAFIAVESLSFSSYTPLLLLSKTSVDLRKDKSIHRDSNQAKLRS
jgi:hypothetical protein